MKKLFVLFSLLFCLCGIAKSEEGGIYFKFGDLQFTYPASNMSVIALYDFNKSIGYAGAETRLIKWLRLNFNLGAITSFEANGSGFISLDYDWAEIINDLPAAFTKLGVWYGKNSVSDENMIGIKASVPIW